MNGGMWVYLLRDQEQKNRFISFGPWESPESVAIWRESPGFEAAFAGFRELCDDIRPGLMQEIVSLKK